MTITQRKDGRYQAVIRDDEYGNPLPKPVYFYDRNRKQLELKVRQFRADRKRGRLFQEVREAWEEEHFRDLAHNTWVSYSPALKRAAQNFDTRPVKDMTPLEIERTVRLMAKQGYSHQSCKIYLSAMRQICDYAVLHGDIDINPCEAIRLPRGLPKTRRLPPDDTLIQTIIEHVDDDFGLYLYFLLYTGLRRGEALAIDIQKDLDFEARLIHVRHSVYFVGDRPYLKDTKTLAGMRDVVMLDNLYDKLLPYRHQCGYLFGGAKLMTLKALVITPALTVPTFVYILYPSLRVDHRHNSHFCDAICICRTCPLAVGQFDKLSRVIIRALLQSSYNRRRVRPICGDAQIYRLSKCRGAMLAIHIDTASLEHADLLANRILSLILIQIGQCGFDFCTSDTNKQVCSIRCAHRHDRAARIFQRCAKRDGSRSAGRSGVYDHVRLPCIASGKSMGHRCANRLRIQSHKFFPP